MNRIAGRSGIAMLLVLVLIGGLVFFVGEYFLEADDWINAAGTQIRNHKERAEKDQSRTKIVHQRQAAADHR